MRLKFDFDETRNKAYVRYFEGLSVLLFTVDFILIKRNSISKKKIWSCWTYFYREKKNFHCELDAQKRWKEKQNIQTYSCIII